MIKVLENTHTKNRRLKIEAATKMNHCFTICPHEKQHPKNIEISTPIALEVWWFWCEADMLSLDPKWLPSKPVLKRTELKIQLYELRYFIFADARPQ